MVADESPSMQFKDVIGQNNIQQTLREMVQQDRIPHAQLLLGAPGSGKLGLALAFAQYVLCENRSATDACGVCNACHKVSKLIHPDLHFSYPVVGSKITSVHFLEHWRSAIEHNPYMNVNQWLRHIGAENKQGNINKDECVSIIKKLSLKTFEGSHKILILWLPEFLQKEGNRLLKLIEEPPPQTLFLLVAENQELILNTILSRCQIIKVNPLPDEVVVNALEQKVAIPRTELEAIAHLANGDFNEALQLLEKRENNNAQLFLDWLRRCYRGNGVELVSWVEQFAGIGRENQKHFLRYALHFLREYMSLKLTGQAKVRLRTTELETAKKMTKVIEFAHIEQIAKLFDDCSYYVERNANPKILFLDASIQMHHILKTPVPQF
ncbi:MAG: DNA polymerase III subunit [Bacteroidota bacterium]